MNLGIILSGSAFVLSLLCTILGVNFDEKEVSESHLWKFLTNYLLFSCFVFVIIIFTEFLEFLSDFKLLSHPETISSPINLFIAIPLTAFLHFYAIYMLLKLSDFRIESIDPNKIGLPIVYVSVFWLLSIELKEIKPLVHAISLLTELMYLISFPVVLLLIYYTIKEKKIEYAMVELPIKSVERLAGIPLAFSLFSLAVLMSSLGYKLDYDILESFALAVFAVSGEIYRREIFKMRKIL